MPVPEKITLTFDLLCQTGKTCPLVADPEFGIVQRPCIRKYGFTCMKKCAQGYHMDGDGTTKCLMSGNETMWTDIEKKCKGEKKSDDKVIVWYLSKQNCNDYFYLKK